MVLHSPQHDASFPSMDPDGATRVIELWSERTAALGARPDVNYVFVFENRGQADRGHHGPSAQPDTGLSAWCRPSRVRNSPNRPAISVTIPTTS